MRRSLTLVRETLTALTDADLDAVRGAAIPTLDVLACLSLDRTCIKTTV
jgi:hypothetical protein